MFSTNTALNSSFRNNKEKCHHSRENFKLYLKVIIFKDGMTMTMIKFSIKIEIITVLSLKL